MEKTTIYLPSDLLRALKEMARRTRKSQAEIIREALAEHLREIAAPLPSTIGIVEDPEFRGADAELWLEKYWGGRDHP